MGSMNSENYVSYQKFAAKATSPMREKENWLASILRGSLTQICTIYGLEESET